jgi:hypothetical protein
VGLCNMAVWLVACGSLECGCVAWGVRVSGMWRCGLGRVGLWNVAVWLWTCGSRLGAIGSKLGASGFRRSQTLRPTRPKKWLRLPEDLRISQIKDIVQATAQYSHWDWLFVCGKFGYKLYVKCVGIQKRSKCRYKQTNKQTLTKSNISNVHFLTTLNY